MQPMGMQPMKTSADRMPGTTPAMNRREIETSAMMPKMIIRIEGGISEPSVPAEATQPVASAGSYFALRISGTEMREKAAAVATLEPQAVAKEALPSTVADASEPGTGPRNMRAEANSPWVRPLAEAT